MYETFSEVGDPANAGSPPFLGHRTRFLGVPPLKSDSHYAMITQVRLECHEPANTPLSLFSSTHRT